jgi:DNA invertase Pin-like site-specific DNA recombinase
MPANPHAEAARTEALGRLVAYREAHANLHANIRHAAELGFGKTTIARASGLTRQGVAKILNRPESP